MGLTVKEKEHWKERISLRIKRAIDEIYETRAPKLKQDVRRQLVLPFSDN